MRMRPLAAALWLLPLLSFSVPSMATATIVEKRTAAPSDDAEEFATGSMYLNSSDLELIHDSDDQTVGMRFAALAIPNGATISAAYIQFSAKESQSEVTSLTIRGQAADNATTFTSTNGNVSTRPRTTASIAWNPVAWNSGESGAGQRTPDLSAVIQAIVSRSGWANGNALALIVTGTGHRTAYAYDGSSSLAPLLHIEYGTGTSLDNPPVAALSVTQLASPARTVSADGSGSTDTDATPIASYRFTFGDGTAAVTTTAPTSSAQHTYATAGTYTVTLIATDTGGRTSSTVSKGITVNSVDNPPVAALSVTQLASPALTVSANGSGSTDTDATPIASYRFTFGDGTAAVTTTAPTSSAQHTYATAGTYTVTLIATDTGGKASSTVSKSITVNPPVITTVEKRTAASSDDAEENAGGSMSLSSSDLELIHDSSDQIVGMRWTGLAIPSGATISNAYIQFSAKESQSEVTNLTIRGQAADNAATFTSSSLNVSTRSRTTASATWNPVAWNSGEVGANQRTPNLSAVIQAIVSRPGWASGNALAIIVNGTGHRTAYAYDGSSSNAPLLHVEFSGGTPPPPSTGVAVYAGYYDTHHTGNPKSKPSPWMGSSGVLFIGNPDTSSGGWDTSGIRIDNLGATSLSGVVVTVDMGSSHFALWGTHAISAGGKLILAQTAVENFDGSDTNSAGCFDCSPNDCSTKVSSAVPVVHVTIGSKTTDYVDPGQILNTHGVDAAGCPYTGTRNDESSPWTQIYPRLTAAAGAARDSTTDARVSAPGAPEFAWLAPPAPNPSRGVLQVAFRTPTRGNVRLEVYDVAGRLVLTGMDGMLEAGDHHQQLDLSGASAGIYYCNLSTAQGSRRSTFVLVR